MASVVQIVERLYEVTKQIKKNNFKEMILNMSAARVINNTITYIEDRFIILIRHPVINSALIKIHKIRQIVIRSL